MDTLPSDVVTVIQDFCGTRDLGYGLSCSGKAWRASDATWTRLASRHPLTRLAVKYVSSDYARWCASLYTVQRPTATARALTYSWDDEHGLSVDPAPNYILRIWSGGALVAVETLECWSKKMYSMNVATQYLCLTNFSDIPWEGVTLLPGQSLCIDIVALPPSVGQDFVPTLVYSAFITPRGVDDQIASGSSLIAQLLPQTLSPLFESDKATCFNQVGASVLATGDHDQYDWYPRCYARIVRDTNGEMTGLHVNQFWWQFPAPCLQSVMLNRRG